MIRQEKFRPEEVHEAIALIAKLDFYRLFECEWSQYDYNEDDYYPMLFQLAEGNSEYYGIPARDLIDFARQVH